MALTLDRLRQRLGLSRASTRSAIARHVGLAVYQQHEQWRSALLHDALRKLARHVNACREWRGAAARQSGQATLGTHQRACGRQQHGCRAAAEGQHCHAVASHIAICQQKLCGPLGFREPMQGLRPGCVDAEDRDAFLAHAKAPHMEVAAPHQDRGLGSYPAAPSAAARASARSRRRSADRRDCPDIAMPPPLRSSPFLAIDAATAASKAGGSVAAAAATTA
ncbi:MAG: hypothetical protein ABIR54_19850 [Burkholderiaceae bacterium]